MSLTSSKRRRRLLFSDDDEPAVKTRRAPTRLPSGPVTTLSDRKSVPQNASSKGLGEKVPKKSSGNSSPGKAIRQRKEEENKSRSLHAFFGRATAEQRWDRKDKTPPAVFKDDDAEDDIEDDSLDEAFAKLSDPEENENTVLDRRKAAQATSLDEMSKAVRHTVGSNQKFAKPPKPAAKVERSDCRHNPDLLNRPWAERFAPESLEELAVHKKKVVDVENWLKAVLQGRDRRVCDAPRACIGFRY